MVGLSAVGPEAWGEATSLLLSHTSKPRELHGSCADVAGDQILVPLATSSLRGIVGQLLERVLRSSMSRQKEATR